MADLSGRVVHVAAEPEPVAAGACVQAAGVLYGRMPDWVFGAAAVVEPRAVDRDAVRARYRAAAHG